MHLGNSSFTGVEALDPSGRFLAIATSTPIPPGAPGNEASQLWSSKSALVFLDLMDGGVQHVSALLFRPTTLQWSQDEEHVLAVDQSATRYMLFSLV